MDINIRHAGGSDAVIIAEFNARMAKETENLELDRELLRRGTEALLADSPKGVYHLAETGENVIGQLMITYEWSDWRNATFWWIQSVYVLPEYRASVACLRKLFQHIESLARTRGDVCGLRLYVDTSNKHAQQTYKALGMDHSHYQMMEMDIH